MRIISALFGRKIETGPNADNIRIIYLVVKSKRDQNNPHFFDAAIIRIISASGPDFGFVNAIPK